MLKPIANVAPQFEDEEGTAATPAAPAEAVKPSVPAAVAVAQPSTQLTKPGPSISLFGDAVDVVGAFKNAGRVTFDQFETLILQGAGILKRDGLAFVATELNFRLMSWQDSYLISAGNDSAPKDLLRFSDDGITTTEGEDVREYVNELRASGWPKASCQQRAIVVGSYESGAKPGMLEEDQIFKLDLSPQSRAAFAEYQVLCQNKQFLGKWKAEQCHYIRITALNAVRNGKTFVKASFTCSKA